VSLDCNILQSLSRNNQPCFPPHRPSRAERFFFRANSRVPPRVPLRVAVNVGAFFRIFLFVSPKGSVASFFPFFFRYTLFPLSAPPPPNTAFPPPSDIFAVFSFPCPLVGYPSWPIVSPPGAIFFFFLEIPQAHRAGLMRNRLPSFPPRLVLNWGFFFHFSWLGTPTVFCLIHFFHGSSPSFWFFTLTAVFLFSPPFPFNVETSVELFLLRGCCISLLVTGPHPPLCGWSF